MVKFFKNLFDPSRQILKDAELKVPEIREFIDKYEDKSINELKRIIDKHREDFQTLVSRVQRTHGDNIKLRQRGEGLDPIETEIYNKIQEVMPEVYAIMALQTKAKLGIMHYDVQLQAAAVLATGQKLVEMKTGEGKTNTFQLPLFLYGLTGRGAHLVTVNDYLAKRDGEYAGHVFHDLGVTVGVITPEASYKFISDDKIEELKGTAAKKERDQIGEDIRVSKLTGSNLLECPKQEAYECDVVVGTNNEFGFDYLRDNMVQDKSKVSQRELYFCIVDEADSILIDEARTPLIISSPAAQSNKLYETFAKIVPKLIKDEDFTVEEKEKAALLTDKGIEKLEKLLNVKNIWEDYALAHHLENALKARVFYEKDKQYLIREGQVMIVDEFTGRVLAGRRYSEGLHQAIEAKEGVEIQQESRTLATITFQNFFRIYKILTGGSGTIMTEQEEFFKIYNLEAAAIPTNRPVIRDDASDRIYKNQAAKFNAVANEIEEAHENGQPILVGTTSISDSEYISNLLDSKKIKHEVLNAKFHEREAQIVAKAGQVKAVTVATNMAGRGTDIPLGEGAEEKGGLYVIGTERHESRRIDNQLRGRSGRQGEAGKSRFFVALDDQVMKMQGGDIIKRIMSATNVPDDIPIESGIVSNSIERAQKKMEGMYFDSRKRVVEYDDVINRQREIFYTRRSRYVSMATDIQNLNAEIGKSDDSEKINAELEKKTQELITEFKEINKTLAETLIDSLFVSESNIDFSKESKKVIGNLLGFAQDKILIKAVNELKLSKDKIDSTEGLSKLLLEIIKKNKENPEKLKQQFANILDISVSNKVNSINNKADLIRIIFLRTMDELWTYHLDYMQNIREGVGLRGVAQKDPLVEYKNEGFVAFQELIGKIGNEALQSLLQVEEFSPAPVTTNVLDQTSVQTNASQISDVLTGTREFAASTGNSKTNSAKKPRTDRHGNLVNSQRSNLSSGSGQGQKMSRRMRRQIARDNRKNRKK